MINKLSLLLVSKYRYLKIECLIGLTIWLFLELFLLKSSFAVNAELYKAWISVPERMHSVKAEFFQEALIQVLKKVTANPDITQNPAIDELITNAKQWVLQYGYEETTQGLYLNVVFDEEALERWLREHAIQTKNQRPIVLLWLNLNGQSLSSLNESIQKDLKQMFKISAFQVGLPILFPLQDLTEMQALSGKAKSHENTQSLEQILKHYHANILWIAHIEEKENLWHLDSTLLWEGKKEHLSLQLPDKEALIAESIQAMMKMLATEADPITPDEHGLQDLVITVKGINVQEDIQNILGYLKNFPEVISIEMKSAQGSEVVYQLKLSHDKRILMDIIERDKRLIPIRITDGQHIFYRLGS